ncbi:MAG TPA: hypothetical protein VGJ26_17940 [Pirellulales bacterium]|jgi:hypothetical protein
MLDDKWPAREFSRAGSFATLTNEFLAKQPTATLSLAYLVGKVPKERRDEFNALLERIANKVGSNSKRIYSHLQDIKRRGILNDGKINRPPVR